jgi:chemotaxis signal transduction protein
MDQDLSRLENLTAGLPGSAALPGFDRPPAPRSHVHLLDDQTQEVFSAPRTCCRQQVPLKPTNDGRGRRYGLVVRNPVDGPIHAVRVEHQVPLGLRYLAAEPLPRRHARRLLWSLPVLRPGESLPIRLRVVPAREVVIADDQTVAFDISYIRNSGLVVSIVGPREMRLGERAVLQLRVLNAGQRRAAPMLFCRLGSTAPGSKVEVLETQVGPLAPGESKLVHLHAEVRKLGTLQCLATAVAPGSPEVTACFESRIDYGAALGKAGRAAAAGQTARLAELLNRDTPGTRHLILSLAGREYAAAFGQVVAIDHLPSWTPVPHAPDWLLGVCNLRGDITSVVDLRGFLGLPPAEQPERARLLVIRAAEVVVGLVVDGVIGLRALEARPGGSSEEGRLSPYVRGLAAAEGQTWPILDLDRLLSSSEMRRFETE